MINRVTRLRFRRYFKRSRRHVEDMSSQAEESLDRHLIRRLMRLLEVRRFVLSWIMLLVLLFSGLVLQTRALSQYYQVLEPTEGGTYTEGIVGAFTNANPLYATGAVDSSVAKLVFASLLKDDRNGQLTGDLAESWKADERETVYTVVLKPNLHWHDGKPLTSADVVFTYQVIQNPDARSPLFGSWQGIKVEAKDERTVTFELPSQLSAFPHSLTNGLIPKHLLEGVPMSQLRSVPFNTTSPIGSGPFRWQTIEVVGSDSTSREERVGLVPYENYHFGKPHINQFVIRAIKDEQQLIENFRNREVKAAVGLSSVPDELNNDLSVEEYNIPLTGVVMTFFRSSFDLFNDVKMRTALSRAIDPKGVIAAFNYPVIPADAPLLKTHVGYDKSLVQTASNIEEANKMLDELGWTRENPTAIRSKNGRPLSFHLISQSTSEYATVSQQLQKQWRAIGVDVIPDLKPEQELQTTIALHNYDMLLYGISIGGDPDVFAYWHSSQADIRAKNRLNFSEYASTKADRSLEAGRTRSEPAIRAAKYRPFLEAWRDDHPAISLYQPRFLYLVHDPLFNFAPTTVNIGTDRFTDVHEWMIRQEKVRK